MDLRQWIHAQHDDLGSLVERTILNSTPRDLLHVRPDGMGNSIIWLLWHVARVEDVAINTIVRGVAQVLIEGDWQKHLGLADHRIGTGFDETEVEELSRVVAIDEVQAYWKTVRTETSRGLAEVRLETLDAVPDLDARLGAIPPIVPERARWLLDFWRGRTAGFFVRLPALDHGYLHLGEMLAIRGRLGIPGR